MNRGIRLFVFVTLGMLGGLGAAAQEAPSPNPGSAPPPHQGQENVWVGQANGPRPLFGKITALHDGSMEITRPEGQIITVKLTPQTEFRKDRGPARVTDFKVGDVVMVRGDENPDHSVTARMIGARSGGPGGAPGSGGGMMGVFGGTLGKDYVLGEVKSIDSPRLTVLRPDNVTQVLELNEDTTLRKGRESITMADIQVGDHLMAHGAVQKDVFVPKGVMVMTPEQWQRFQEFPAQGSAAKPAVPGTSATKPQE